MPHPEKILVVPASRVAELVPQGFSFDTSSLERLILPSVAQFRVRDDVEHDPAWKQVIPYVTFLSLPLSVFTYTRAKAGGEARLHDLLSIGVGGHVEETDLPWRDPWGLTNAVAREVEEEVEFNGRNVGFAGRVTGLINDDSTDVGRHHLGVFYSQYVFAKRVAAKEDHLEDAKWLGISDLRTNFERFETWSQLVLSACFID